MKEYIYDEKTGGIVLTYKDSYVSSEPRPVYAQELNILGIDEFWNYNKEENDIPYMWVEANNYIYKGKKIFSITGGNLYEKPKIEIEYIKDKNKNPIKPVLDLGNTLDLIDIKAMCEANKDELASLTQDTIRKTTRIYKKYKDKLDCFHVAFSGGKDSIVLLDIVKKAIPKSSLIVIFGDTQMEFPDTYKVVDLIEEQCKNEEIDFYRATSHLKPEESWRLFGPPSRDIRWCCSVHKSAPQTLKIREILGKNNYVGMDFVGVRAFESDTRAAYEQEDYGKKQKGQHAYYPLLNWNSAEIWIYIFSNNLVINEAYKKGNSRAGCLFCPMGGGNGDYFQITSYSNEVKKLVDIVKEMNLAYADDELKLNSYVSKGGWNARKNARDLKIYSKNYFEYEKDKKLYIKIKLTEDWKQWIKILEPFSLNYTVEKNEKFYTFIISDQQLDKKFLNKKNSSSITLKRAYKQVFKKAANCIGCKVCEMNCQLGCISFNNGLKIDNCSHCGNCHDLVNGCLLYNSLVLPKGEKSKVKKDSINSFANHAPKEEWIKDIINKEKDNIDFWSNNSLGPQQKPRFKKFMKACNFIDSNKNTKLFNLLMKKGYNSKEIWGIALVNFAYNTQCLWYINNMNLNEFYSRDSIAVKLINDGLSKDDATSVINAFKRFCDMPFGKLIHFGSVRLNNNKIVSLSRTKTNIDDSRILLYSLYKYAEECENYYQFSLSTLLDNSIESKGISPVKIFGYSANELITMLNGLSVKYTDYIFFSNTHGLEKISLMDYHKSEDILDLF